MYNAPSPLIQVSGIQAEGAVCVWCDATPTLGLAKRITALDFNNSMQQVRAVRARYNAAPTLGQADQHIRSTHLRRCQQHRTL